MASIARLSPTKRLGSGEPANRSSQAGKGKGILPQASEHRVFAEASVFKRFYEVR